MELKPIQPQTSTPVSTRPAKTGYVLKRYPRFSETFIVNEILAHEASGREMEIFALRSVEETHFQDIIAWVRAPVTRIRDRYRGADDLWQAVSGLWSEIPESWAKLPEFQDASGRDVVQAIELAIACRRRGVEHLHAHFGTVASTVARIAAKLAGMSWSMTLHAKDIYYQYEENQNLAQKMGDADAVITVSDFNRDYLATVPGAEHVGVHRLYNGIDLENFTWAESPSAATEILAVGRLIEKKGFHLLIEAVRMLVASGRSDLRCRIVGEGEDRPDLAAQIEASGLAGHVELVGPLPQADVKAAMREAALLACPCIVGEDGNRDGMPTVLLEAMALGCPCVATPVTGIPELVDDGISGLIVPESEADGLASAMARLLDDPALRRRLSAGARRRMERDFDLSVNVPKLGAMFDAMVESRRARQWAG